MHRNQLIHLLNCYTPSDHEEKASKQQILSFINEQPDCFERTLEVGHITASCWLVNHDNTKALLTHHKKLNKWLQLGGHCDGDSDVVRVALKEAQEESGLNTIKLVSDQIFDISIHFIPQYKDVPGHYHYDIRFLLQAIGNEEIVISDESHDLVWINKDGANLPANSDSVSRMFNKWREYQI